VGWREFAILLLKIRRPEGAEVDNTAESNGKSKHAQVRITPLKFLAARNLRRWRSPLNLLTLPKVLGSDSMKEKRERFSWQ
jgi:hypothetical protein